MNRITVGFATCSSIIAVTFNLFLRWRAKSRSRNRPKESEKNFADGPMIDSSDATVCQSILASALRRVPNLLGTQHPTIMTGQVGGISLKKRPILQLAPDYILKPMQSGNRGIREVAFYEANLVASVDAKNQGSSGRRSTLESLIGTWMSKRLLHENIVADSENYEHHKLREQLLLARLVPFIPSYYGVLEYSPEQHDQKDTPTYPYVVLQDLTSRFSKPCVMDIKVGTETYEPDAPLEKQRREASKYPPQTVLGLRIVDMRIHDPHHPDGDALGFRMFGKALGRSLLTRSSVLEALRLFFSRRNSILQLHRLVAKLKSLSTWFEDNDRLSFYASSILFVYEGDRQANNVEHVELKMIDFGHVRRSSCGDKGYKIGLTTLLSLVEELLLDAKTLER